MTVQIRMKIFVQLASNYMLQVDRNDIDGAVVEIYQTISC